MYQGFSRNKCMGGGGIGRHFYFLPTMHQIFKIITPPYTKYKLLLYPPCIKFN